MDSMRDRQRNHASRLLIRVLMSPIVTLSIVASGVAFLGVVPLRGEFYLLGSFLAPWLFLGLVFLNLPFVVATTRRFRLPEATKRNHALEHGTIFFLKKRYGKKVKLSGESDERGFRISGAPSKKDVEDAFAQLKDSLAQGNCRPVVANGCGSNIVTTQAFGLALLAVTAVAFIMTEPRPMVVLLTLIMVLAAVVIVRYPLGMWVQKKRFLSLHFTEASIHSISGVDRTHIFERPPVFFVWTRIH